MKSSLKSVVKHLILLILSVITFPLRHFFPSKLKLERYTIEVPNLSSDLDGFQFAQLSDFHWDHHPRTSKELMNDVINTTNSLNLDAIFLTGDYVQHQPSPIKEFARDYLCKFTSRLGTFAIYGMIRRFSEIS